VASSCGVATIGIDARRRFSSIVYNGIRRLTCGKCEVFWRRGVYVRRDAWRRFSMSSSVASRRSSVPNMSSCFGVVMLGVDFQAQPLRLAQPGGPTARVSVLPLLTWRRKKIQLPKRRNVIKI
jgi:hypothetical protein